MFAIKIADIFAPENRKRILNTVKKGKTFLPSPETIFSKDIVIENDIENKNYKKNKYYNNSYSTYGNYNTNGYYDEEYYDGEEYGNGYYYDNNNYNNKKEDDGLYKAYSDNNFYVKKPNYQTITNNTCSDKKDNNINLEKNLKEVNESKNSKDFLNIKENTINKSTNADKMKNLDSDNQLFLSEKVKSCFNRKELYRKRECSRFNFVNSVEKDKTKDDNENINIPDYINELIYKKVSKITFFKIFKHSKSFDDSEVILNNKESKNDNWAQFLLSCREKKEKINNYN